MADRTTIAVHRCRFIDYTPSPITALAFPPLPLPSTKNKHTTVREEPLQFGTLAIGHANGNIDICEWAGGERDLQSSQAWVVRKTLSGLYPSKVDSITLAIRYPDDFKPTDVPSCLDLRLFSSGGGSELLEWDIGRGCVRRTISSQGGSIWCMALNPASSLLALGCEDGTVRLLSLRDDTLSHYRRFDRVKCRVLSIAWGPPQPHQHNTNTSNPAIAGRLSDDDSDNEDEWTDMWLVTGGSDSSIRKWDVSTGRVMDRMGTDKIRGERTLVWAVGVLGDGTIISGDSLGMVKFWDSRTCTQLHSFQGHGADVLCLAIGPEGKTIMTSGVDQKISQFSLVKTATAEQKANTLAGPSSRWVQTCSRRMHSHDVRALATWPPYTTLPPSYRHQFPIEIAPILASGGLDMSVVLTPTALPSATVVKIINPLSTSTDCTFEDSYHRRLSYVSGPSCTSALQVARQARLVSCMADSEFSLWRIPLRQSLPDDEDLTGMQEDLHTTSWEKVLEMDLKAHTNLIASRISDDGRWLVISDFYETKLFSLTTNKEGRLTLKRIRDFSSILQAHIPDFNTHKSTGGAAFQFTPDSSKLIMSSAISSYVIVIDLTGEKPCFLRRFDHHRIPDSTIHNRVIKGRKIDSDVEMEDVTVDPTEESDSEDERDTITPANVNISRISISPDGQWLVTSDDRARTHVFNLDSIQHHSVLPSFSKPTQFLCFDPVRPNILIMAFPDNSLQIYNVESRQFPTWGKELCNNLPKRFTHAHDPILGVTFDPAQPLSTNSSSPPRYALFWGSTWICKLPLNDITGANPSKKRRRENAKISGPLPVTDDSSGDFKMITHYRPILLVDFLAAGELVVVERPLVDVLSTLPPAYFKHKYGSS